MTEFNPASKSRAVLVAVSAQSAKQFAWTRDERPYGRPSLRPAVNAGADSSSRKPYAQSQWNHVRDSDLLRVPSAYRKGISRDSLTSMCRLFVVLVIRQGRSTAELLTDQGDAISLSRAYEVNGESAVTGKTKRGRRSSPASLPGC
jgi:hypothetical protein